MTAPDPLRVAVVGSGPAGFYAASNLLSERGRGRHVRAAADAVGPRPRSAWRRTTRTSRPSRRCSRRWRSGPASGSSATSRSARTCRPTTCARTTTRSIWSVGAQADRRMGIPGEDLPGSLAATAFVAWYNGHPDYADLDVDLDVDRIVVVGNGNVAVDCARMLALTREELAPTDTTDDAIEAIATSRVHGDRGARPPRAARGGVHDAGAARAGRAGRRRRAGRPGRRPTSRCREDGVHAAAAQRRDRARVRRSGRAPQAARRAAPVPRLAARAARRRPRRGDRDRPQPARAGADGALRAVPTGETEVLACGLVLRSVGYRGTPLEGVPFDRDRAVIPNDGRPDVAPRRVRRRLDQARAERDHRHEQEGRERDRARWCSRTPPRASCPCRPIRRPARSRQLVAERQPHVVEYAGWEAIDAHERDRGEPHGRPRVKLRTWDELMALGRRRSGPASPARSAPRGPREAPRTAPARGARSRPTRSRRPRCGSPRWLPCRAR